MNNAAAGLPLDTYVAVGDRIVCLRDLVGKRAVAADGSVCVAARVEDGETYLVRTASGDFCVANPNMALATPCGPRTIRQLSRMLTKSVRLSPLPGKRLPTLGCLHREACISAAYVEQRLLKGQPLTRADDALNDAVWSLFLHRHPFRLRPRAVLGIRALCELYGFNATMDDDGYFRVRFGRKECSDIKWISWFRAEGAEPLASCNVVRKDGLRPSFQGFGL